MLSFIDIRMWCFIKYEGNDSLAYRGKNQIFGQQSNNMWLISILFTYFSKCLIWKTVQRRRHFEKDSCLMMHNCRINNSNSSEYRTNHLQHLEIVDRNYGSCKTYIYIYCVLGINNGKFFVTYLLIDMLLIWATIILVNTYPEPKTILHDKWLTIMPCRKDYVLLRKKLLLYKLLHFMDSYIISKKCHWLPAKFFYEI